MIAQVQYESAEAPRNDWLEESVKQKPARSRFLLEWIEASRAAKAAVVNGLGFAQAGGLAASVAPAAVYLDDRDHCVVKRLFCVIINSAQPLGGRARIGGCS